MRALEREYEIKVASIGNHYLSIRNKIRASIARCAVDGPDDEEG